MFKESTKEKLLIFTFILLISYLFIYSNIKYSHLIILIALIFFIISKIPSKISFIISILLLALGILTNITTISIFNLYSKSFFIFSIYFLLLGLILQIREFISANVKYIEINGKIKSIFMSIKNFIFEKNEE